MDLLTMALDRGNSGSKVVASLNGRALEPFKIPSIIRQVSSLQGALQIGKNQYVCGDAAIGLNIGQWSTPLTEGDKTKSLAVVVAKAIQTINEREALTEALKLDISVSSPFSNKALAIEIENELKKLSNGFTVGDKRFTRVEVVSVKTKFEGAVLLWSNPEYDGVIDVGFGTILAAFNNRQTRTAEIVTVPGGDLGGVNIVLKALLNDEKFLAAVKKSGATAQPSLERLSSRLSEGVTELRGIDLKPLLAPHLKVLRERIENASKTILSEVRNSSDCPRQNPKIALIGGGACLLRLCIPADKLEAWSAKNSIDVFDHSPDYQTAMIMHQQAQRALEAA
jgi:hypothetical protein